VSTECYSFYQGLPKFIQKMGVLYPNISVDLNLEATHQPISKIIANELDIAIVSSKPNNDSLTSLEIFEDEVFAILHKENIFAKDTFIRANDFLQLQLIIHSYPLETVSVYEQFLKPNNVTPSQIVAVPLTEVALEMIEANFGVICMPKWALQSFKLSENIMFKSLGEQGLKRKHYLVIRKEDADKKYINDFIVNFLEGI